MSSPRTLGVALAACLLLGGGSVASLSARLIALERTAEEGRAAADLEEKARTALWRMDLSLARLTAEESSRAPESFAAAPASGDVLLRFDLDRSGALPTPSPALAARFETLRGLLLTNSLASGLRAFSLQRTQAAAVDNATNLGVNRSTAEFNFRNRYVQQNAAAPERTGADAAAVMTPTWAGEELLLLREVPLQGSVHRQGCWLDWERIRARLLSDVADLLPGAQLEKMVLPAQPSDRVLASLPVRLVPGLQVNSSSASSSPVRLTLLLAWLGLLVAAVALGLLLAGTLALAERRAAFVSAVTHELRTPLTTFRMYAELLEGGMVAADRQPEYFRTLRQEAERLSLLVENVLAYSRIERGGPPQRTAPVELSSLLERLRPRLEERAARASMQIELGATSVPAALADALAVEQIVVNLVDNACKYATAANDRRVLLSLSSSEKEVSLEVRDFGPGLSAHARRRLFEPFSKSSEESADTALGVGLGLALCRQMARAMGGELTLQKGSGAAFSLTLRRAPPVTSV